MLDDKNNRDLWRVPEPEQDEEEQERMHPQQEFTSWQRRWAALGALKAALLIGAAYLAGLGIIIGLMILLWC